MKGVVLVVLVLGAFAPPVQAAVVWQGEAVLDSATSQCTLDSGTGLKADAVLKSVLRPKNISDNGINTTVSFIADQEAMFAMVLDHGAMPAGTAAVFGHSASAVPKLNVGVPYADFVQSPALPTSSTPTMTLSGTINDFLYIVGCTVTFRAAYSLRKD